MMLADASLTSTTGLVTFSQRKTMKGWKLTTQSGISLICSDAAPILTTEGYVLAPHLLGKLVATRKDADGTELKTAWEKVEYLQEVGTIEVQHISVGDRAFWAGETYGSYVLHHNLKDTGGGCNSDCYIDDNW